MDIEILQEVKRLNADMTPATVDTVSVYVPQYTQEDVEECIASLCDDDLLMMQSGELIITGLGVAEIDSAVSRPVVDVGWDQWYAEATTGMTPAGKESAMVNPAIPTRGRRAVTMTDDRMVDLIDRVDDVARLMRRHHNMSLSDIETAIVNGRVQMCPRCERLGIFRRNKSSSTGLRSSCNKCASGDGA